MARKTGGWWGAFAGACVWLTAPALADDVFVAQARPIRLARSASPHAFDPAIGTALERTILSPDVGARSVGLGGAATMLVQQGSDHPGLGIDRSVNDNRLVVQQSGTGGFVAVMQVGTGNRATVVQR